MFDLFPGCEGKSLMWVNPLSFLWKASIQIKQNKTNNQNNFCKLLVSVKFEGEKFLGQTVTNKIFEVLVFLHYKIHGLNPLRHPWVLTNL